MPMENLGIHPVSDVPNAVLGLQTRATQCCMVLLFVQGVTGRRLAHECCKGIEKNHSTPPNVLCAFKDLSLRSYPHIFVSLLFFKLKIVNVFVESYILSTSDLYREIIPLINLNIQYEEWCKCPI